VTETFRILAIWLDRVSASLNRVSLTLGVSMLIIMLAAVALQVVARYLLASAPTWTEELARYSMVWAGYLGATVAFYSNADPVLHTPSGGSLFMHRFWLVVRNIAGLVFLLPVVYWSPAIIGHHMLRETESLGIVSGYVMLVVPTFCTIILVHIVARLAIEFTSSGQNTVGEML